MLTKRCGTAGAGVPGVEPEESPVVLSAAVTGIGLAAGVSMLKKEITWGLRLSVSAKSSLCRFWTTLPVESRTTTRTRTRLTRTRKVAGVSWVATSAAFWSWEGGGAGAVFVGGAGCVWLELEAGESCPLQRRAKASPQVARRVIRFSRHWMWLGRTYLPLFRSAGARRSSTCTGIRPGG